MVLFRHLWRRVIWLLRSGPLGSASADLPGARAWSSYAYRLCSLLRHSHHAYPTHNYRLHQWYSPLTNLVVHIPYPPFYTPTAPRCRSPSLRLVIHRLLVMVMVMLGSLINDYYYISLVLYLILLVVIILLLIFTINY